MAKRRAEINPIRGKRLRQVLSEHKMDQRELAEKIGYTKEHISYIINGKRNLTPEAAEAIVKIFPDIRLGRLLGIEDCERDSDVIEAKMSEKIMNLEATETLLKFSIKYSGYNIDWPESGNGVYTIDEIGIHSVESAEEFDREVNRFLVKDGRRITITNGDVNNFNSELLRYAIYLLEGLISQKNDTWKPFALTKEDLING